MSLISLGITVPAPAPHRYRQTCSLRQFPLPKRLKPVPTRTRTSISVRKHDDAGEQQSLRTDIVLQVADGTLQLANLGFRSFQAALELVAFPVTAKHILLRNAVPGLLSRYPQVDVLRPCVKIALNGGNFSLGPASIVNMVNSSQDQTISTSAPSSLYYCATPQQIRTAEWRSSLPLMPGRCQVAAGVQRSARYDFES